MNHKDKLQIKLIIYSLLESRNFILHHYDKATAEAIVVSKGDKDRHSMLGFTLESIVPFEGFESNVVNQLISELMREVETFNTFELLAFAKERIPYYVDQLCSQLV
ncbi:hypothetical protein [Streptococcus thoraltensis]|uniref:hypothetical protein n=1 Tax=Streptococcus thoraltensis TaxID=55085 RepID=UPI001F5A5830|nr:hypothetical protein [Streptococcus thoraltensis]